MVESMSPAYKASVRVSAYRLTTPTPSVWRVNNHYGSACFTACTVPIVGTHREAEFSKSFQHDFAQAAMHKKTTIWIPAWVACIVCGLLPTSFAEDRPNIVILYADDLGYGDLGCYNLESKIPTSNLDALAREGRRFTDAHSSSGICSPSRYALLTGRYHWRKFHAIVNSFGPSVFEADDWTLPEMLRAGGYSTACIGKWHLGWNWDSLRKEGVVPQKQGANTVYRPDDLDWRRPIPEGPCAHGFEYYFGDDVPNFPPYTWIENDRVVTVPTEMYIPNPRPAEGAPEGRPGPMAPGWRQDQVMPTLTAKAVEWLRQAAADDKPFFLYFPFTSPHAPILPTEDFQGKSQAGPYGDYVAQSDGTVGQILQTLDELGVRESTLVIFASDNGPETYAYERIRTFEHRSAGPLRGLKRDLWEGGHRVPLIIRWPGRVPAGTVCDGLISQIDLFATLAAIVGQSLPPGAAGDSHDQTPLLFGQGESARNSLVHNTNPNHYAIRNGQWLLIAAPSGSVSKVPDWLVSQEGYDESPQEHGLYDLAADLGQRRNLAAVQPERVRAMLEQLARVRAAAEDR